MSELAEIKKWLKSIEEEPLEEMAGFFSARLEDYEEHMYHWKKLYEWMGELVPDKTETLLDLGCGTGLELDEIFRYHPQIEVTGIDLSADMLAKLREKHPDKKLSLIMADYFADDDEWEEFLFAECDRRRKKWKIPEEVFVHFDTPLTLEHELELLKKAGFSEVCVLGTVEGDDTPMIRAVKGSKNI